ncbi:alpha/beta fold hydrolase [Cellulosilyticum sp. I15G10I2]|uniref:alpha/beta fold hydrolase n=1 Tax=Cellulosilyticum sp. I15G10I2 TaxID=1892843 RepID=UPI00085C5AB0|nr:alpha/beta hydrolase [Cellulosilyticum sp. I15G10I2]
MRKNKKMVLGNYDKKQKGSKKIYIYLLIICMLLVGAFYQIYYVYAHANQYGRVGKLIDVNDSMMHLYTSASSGMPLVFASNIGTSVPYAELYPLFSKFSEEAAIAVYDKPGYGWSELTKAPRDVTTIASEIHTLLHNSNHPLPALFIAHSMGSLEVLRYAQLYPEDVAGIVLIDGASPDFCSKYNNIMIVESFLMNGLRNVGLLRLLSDTDAMQKILNTNDMLPEELKTLNSGITLEKLWNRNMIEEKLKLQSNAKMILEGGTLGDIPLHIITSKTNPYGTWQQTQTTLLKFSSNSTQTYMDGSVNFIEEKDMAIIQGVISSLITSLQKE